MKNSWKFILLLPSWKIFMSHTFAIIIYCHAMALHMQITDDLTKKSFSLSLHYKIHTQWILLFNHHPDLCPVNETSLFLCVLNIIFILMSAGLSSPLLFRENSLLWFDMNGNCCFMWYFVVIILSTSSHFVVWMHVRNWIDKLFDLVDDSVCTQWHFIWIVNFSINFCF